MTLLFLLQMIFNDHFLYRTQALGDLVESIAGAILIDTKLNLDEVWKVFNPLLSPIVTPDKLELPPLRELNELCDSLGYFVKENCKRMGTMVHAELSVQLQNSLLVKEGKGLNKKIAKGEAAFRLLKELEVCCSCLNVCCFSYKVFWQVMPLYSLLYLLHWLS